MGQRMSAAKLRCALVLLAALAIALPAAGQRDTGGIVVHAVDIDGFALPGVQVVARGPVGTQTQYTGLDGSARCAGLYPGTGYEVTFSLEGFKTLVRAGLVVRAARTTLIEVTLEISAVAETINVLGESPVVDTRGTNVGTTYTNDLIDMSPTASGVWAGVLDHVPGVMSSLDVGGDTAAAAERPRAWGSKGRTNQYNINGGDVTEPFFMGFTEAYFSIYSFEEVSVSLAAQDIETKTPGVVMNAVVKSGSNDWHGGVKYFYEGPGLVSDNVDEELEAEGVTEGTPNELLSDLDLQIGGPLVRDRVWVFGDYWRFDLDQVVLGLDERDRIDLRNWTFNGNGQINENHRVSARYFDSNKYRSNRSASRARPYLGWVNLVTTRTPQAQWQAVLARDLFLDLRYSSTTTDFALVRRWPPGADELGAVPSEDSATLDFALGDYVPRPSLPRNEFRNAQTSHDINGTMSWYVTGERTAHDIKFGVKGQSWDFHAPFNAPPGYLRYVDSRRPDEGNPAWADGVPVEIRLYNVQTCIVLDDDCWQRGNAVTVEGSAAGLFVQDTFTFDNRLTVTGGVRWDYATNRNPAQNRLASPWCGLEPLANPEMFCAGSFPAQPPVTWKDLVPRVGLVYDVLGDGRWAIKFNYSRYAEPLGGRFAADTNVNDIGREDWNWTDENGDGRFQFGEQTSFRDARFPVATIAVDPQLRSPFHNEFTFGLEHELADNVLLSVTGIIRGLDDDIGVVDVGRPFGAMLDNPRCLAECVPDMSTWADPYYPVMSVDPGNDGVIGTDDDGLPVTLWARDPAVANDARYLRTNTPTWGFEDYTDYKGVSFVVQKRWAGNWQMLASYDYGRGYQADWGTTPAEVDNYRRQELYGSRPHVFKLTANYLFAEPVGVNLGLFVRSNSGEPVRAMYRYPRALIQPPNSPYCCQGNQTRVIDARGEGNVVGSQRPEREDFVTIVDVRAEKQISIGRYGTLHFYFDVFNLFNSNVVTEFNWNLGRRYGEIQDILPPRGIRIGGAWDF